MLSNGMREFALTLSLLCLITVSVTDAQNLRRKVSITVRGTVVAYEIVPQSLEGSFMGLTSILVVKVSSMSKGTSMSRYVIARYTGDKSEYTALEFANKKTFDFALDRFQKCDATLRSLMKSKIIDDKGQIVETRSNFEIVQGVRVETLPLDGTLPCYFLSSR